MILRCVISVFLYLLCVPAFSESASEIEIHKMVSTYLDSIIENPRNLDIWLHIASLEWQLKNHPLAINAYQHAALLAPNNPEIFKRLSEIYAELNEPKNAFDMIKKAYALAPENADYALAQAQLANWNRDPQIALLSYQQVLLLRKQESPDILLEIARLQNQLHDYGSAIITYKRLIVLQPTSELYHALSQNYAAANKPKEALDAISAALVNDPTNAKFLQEKAILAAWLRNQLKPSMQLVSSIPQIPGTQLTSYLPPIIMPAIKVAFGVNPVSKPQKKPLSLIGTLFDKAQLAALNGDTAKMEAYYEQILQLKPNDERALLNFAFIYAWQGKTDCALRAYRYFLMLYPQSADGWIQYAEALSWTGAFREAFAALDNYRKLNGETKKYLQIKARILAQAGRFNSAECVNNLLLQKTPNDPYLLSTQVTIFNKKLNNEKAVETLEQLHRIKPDYFLLPSLNKIIRTPLRSNVNLGSSYTEASDTTKILQIPIINAQQFLSPTRSVLVQGFYERATAAPNSGLNTINGKNSIFDENIMVGFTKQIPEKANLKGLLGGLKIQGKNNHVIYDVLATTNLDQTAQLTVENSYNLYRPYLVPQSPRLISLQIMENRIGGNLQWQPFIQKYLNVVLSHSNLSLNNSYWHTNFWPKIQVFNSQHCFINAGVNSDLWNYRRRVTGQGYYSPLRFQSYEGTVESYYGFTQNIGLSLQAGLGMQKDETYPHFFYEEDFATQLFLGIYTDWELRWTTGFTLRENPTGNYHSWNTGLILTRRF